MKRRDFITLLGGATIVPRAATAEQPKRIPVVGFVLATGPSPTMTGFVPEYPFARGFLQGMRELGWINGNNFTIEWQTAEGDPRRAPAIMTELLARGIDVLVLTGARWLQEAARAATRTVPIVTIFPDDPIASNLIASFARPGGNITGISLVNGPEFDNKRLQLLLDFAQRVTRVAFLASTGVLDRFRSIAPLAGLTVVPVQVDIDEQFEAAFATIRRERVDALMAGASPSNYVRAPGIVTFAAENRLPAIYAFRESVEAGGLISYGSSIPANFRQIARQVDKFLRGAKIGDIPTELPTTFETVINAKTASALGLQIPQSILVRADEVIE